jgi:D-inositol-3-phosphate glycosyltransferase
MEEQKLNIAMLSVHSSPIGKLGTKDTGGMSVYIRELARELGSRGHRVDIYTRLSDPRCKQRSVLYENVHLIHLRAGNGGNTQKLAIYRNLCEFFQELERFRTDQGLHYDLIHSHYWLSGRVGNWAKDRWDVPHILKFHTLGAVKNVAAKREQEPALRIVTEKHLAKSCHRILAATESEKEQLMRYYGAPPETIGVVPCGVNLEHFCPADKATARQRLGVGLDESVVLYVGRFAPLKGIERLLAAMTYVQDNQRVRLVIIGGDGHHDPEFQKLQRLSQKWGIEAAVTFAGRIEQDNLPVYYSAADVLVVPSHYESFGLVALESLACGTPVVTTKVGAMESIIREGETGHVVSNGSPRLLAKGIEAFVSGPHATSPDAIRASILQFSWANVAAGIIDEYATAVRLHQYASESTANAAYLN